MVERAQPQLLLGFDGASVDDGPDAGAPAGGAGRARGRRRGSARRVVGARMAPTWTMWRRGGRRRRFGRPARERMIAKRLEAARLGELDPDAEEPDPEQFFRAQWLNQWPRRRAETPKNTEDLLPPGLWAELVEEGLWTDAPVTVALEDDYGRGAAVGVVAPLGDGRLEVDGWKTDDWDTAIADVERLAITRPIRELYVGRVVA